MTTEFVKIELKNKGPGCAESNGAEEIIKDYAAKGFAYSGYVPVKYGPSGKLLIMELVFQK